MAYQLVPVLWTLYAVYSLNGKAFGAVKNRLNVLFAIASALFE